MGLLSSEVCPQETRVFGLPKFVRRISTSSKLSLFVRKILLGHMYDTNQNLSKYNPESKIYTYIIFSKEFRSGRKILDASNLDATKF